VVDGRVPRVPLRALRNDPLATLASIARNRGDAASFRVGSLTVHLFSHPDLVREVLAHEHRAFEKGRGLKESRRILGNGLLTSEGAIHRHRRHLIQPLFHRREIARYAGVMVSHAREMSARWVGRATVDMHDEMGRLALSIVAETLFGADLEAAATSEITRALKVSVDMFGRAARPFAGVVEHLPLPSSRRFRAARKVLDDAVASMTADRRADRRDRSDLLSLLLGAIDGGGRTMTAAEVRDEAMTIFLAGHETTALALTWAWYLLARHPEAEARLHMELEDVLCGREPGIDDVPRLGYTRMVLAESMRLYPPAWAIGRRALHRVYIGETSVDRGDIVVVSQWVTHRDARFWLRPNLFEPGRFSPEAAAARPKYAYFPFGAGPRICIGEHFAWMEGTLLLACLAQRWRPRIVEEEAVELQPSITLRPRNGLRMELESRASLPAPV
jgi:cytochrome P450